jgi:hypothetical protein
MSFLLDYKEYATEITDAPENYHDYMGLALVGIILGNKCFFPYGDTRIYPNIWLILLGDSSSSRKTTAINIGKRILSEVNPELIYPNEFSQEKIQGLLEKRPCGCFFFSEFVSLMGLLSRDYLAGTKGFLADLYDSPFIYKRETEKKSIRIENPSISIISATNQSWFTEKMKESDIIGGFIPRFIIIMPDPKKKNLSIPPEADLTKRHNLVKQLLDFEKISGSFVIKPDARAYFDSWYNKICSLPGNSKIQPFIHRLQTYTLKFAIILNVINECNTKISLETMKQSVDYVYKIAKKLTKMEDEDLIFGKVQQNMKKIVDCLRKHGKQPKSFLMNYTKLISKDFKEASETLIESEKIKVQLIKTSTKPLLMYELVENGEDGF